MNATQRPFDLFGGELGVRKLVDAFYDRMDFEAEFATIRALHPTTLEESRNKLYWFLCGWLGGPNHTSSVSGIRVCARGICRLRLAASSAINGWLV